MECAMEVGTWSDTPCTIDSWPRSAPDKDAARISLLLLSLWLRKTVDSIVNSSSQSHIWAQSSSKFCQSGSYQRFCDSRLGFVESTQARLRIESATTCLRIHALIITPSKSGGCRRALFVSLRVFAFLHIYAATSSLVILQYVAGTDITDNMIEQAAELFSRFYGVWGPLANQHLRSFAKQADKEHDIVHKRPFPNTLQVAVSV